MEVPVLRLMSSYRQTETREQPSNLTNHALAAGDVVIKRDGCPVVKIKAVEPESAAPALTQAGIDWIIAHRMHVVPGGLDAVELVREMRNGGY